MTLNTSQPIQGLELSHLAGNSKKMGEDRRILIPKEKEASSGKQYIWELSLADCGFRRGPSHSEDLKSKNTLQKAKIRKSKLKIARKAIV